MKRALTLLVLLCAVSVTYGQQHDFSKLNSVISRSDELISNDTNAYFQNVDSWIMYYQGEIKFEKYYHGFTKDSLHHIQSQTKSIVSLLTGIAIDQGSIKSEEQLASTWFSEKFSQSDTLKSKVRLRDLLTMSGGFLWEEMLPFDDQKNDNANMYRSGHWLRYALSRPMLHEPFTVFKYNSGSHMIVAGIVEKATGMPLEKFAERNLFNKLGIERFRWQKDSTGFCHAGGGLHLKPSDMIKIGIMVLNNGMYNGKRIIPEAWLEKSFKPYFKTEFGGKSYGFFWWVKDFAITKDRTTKVISAEGAGGQSLFIIPEFSMVISFTEHNYTTPQVGLWILKDYILPALK